MKFVLDTHTHTIASGHAYNTINEMAQAAAKKGLELLAVTEHAPGMPGSCHEYYFHNLRVLRREKYGVKLLFGCELNIIDKEGRVDLPEYPLNQIDIGIASMHTPCYKSGTVEENTRAYCKAMEIHGFTLLAILMMADFRQIIKSWYWRLRKTTCFWS